ncbi:MAG: metal-dependent hydrolase [Candidatus Nealsonbacteria bacterium]|nr:metal-dependent hydrolase [Candidatus Nealsonbacteria bacterium]
MAGFRTHITFSAALGAGYAAAAYALFEVPLPTCVLAGGLCGVSGMLPDVDSNAGVPLRESMAFAAAVIPLMMLDRFGQLDVPTEWLVLAGAAVYLFIRFVVAAMLRKYTVHRGMFHSLPAAIIAGEFAFLLASGDDVRLRIYKAGGVTLGYLSHLVLDELYSMEWYHGRLRLKKSFGTALKLFGRNWWPNISTFAKLAILTYVVLKEPGWLPQHYGNDVRPTVERTATTMIDRVVR